MNLFKREYFTIVLTFLLLILILVSQNIINKNNNNFFYILIIINLLIIVSCLIDLSNTYNEKFLNLYPLKNKNCYIRSKEYDTYNYKIDTRLNNLRKIEIKDRKEDIYRDEQLKFNELKNMNKDYLINGELFE